MGISHEASEARLLTKQGRQRGHWGLWYHTNLQMGTRGPISCYPITKKVPSSLPPPPPPHFFPLVPPPSHPPLRNRRENRRCWDCIIASITVIIYTSILSYSLFLLAIAINLTRLGVCSWDMQRSAGSYFRKSPPPSQKSNNWHFSHVEKPGEVQGEWQTRNFTKSGHSFYLLRAVTWVEVQCGEQVRENLRKKKKRKRKPQGEVKTLGTLEWPSFGEEERSWVEAHPLPHPALALLGFL